MEAKELTIEEIEDLSYYDFMAHLKAPFFNIGGISSIEELAEMCNICEGKKILVVGCGTGFNSCYLAKNFECTVIGIDIAELMIQKAIQRAEEENLTDKVKFKVGNAYDLEFDNDSFDAIITAFVSQFLILDSAFKEFFRVLKPGGYLGINEMFKADNISFEANKLIEESEEILQELTDFPFTLYTVSDWRKAFQDASLTNVQIREFPYENIKVTNVMKDIGGFKPLMKMTGRLISYAWKSKTLRKKFGLLSKTKRKLFRNKKASKFVGYLLCTGMKS